MSVTTQLGLDDPSRGLLARAEAEWPQWCALDPELAAVPQLRDLPGWLRAADYEAGERLLRSLGRLASANGGDHPAAAAALIWVLIPGATMLAVRLRHLAADIDALVAAQLWLEVRGLRWQTTWKVAATVLLNTRRGVLADLGFVDHRGGAWRQCAATDPSELAAWAGALVYLPDDPGAEIDLLLDRACEDGVIDEAERALLTRLMAVSDKIAPVRRGAMGGLACAESSACVAAETGVSARTIRRRARRSVAALTEAYAVNRISA